ALAVLDERLQPQRLAAGLLVDAGCVDHARQRALLVLHGGGVAFFGAPVHPGRLHVVDDIGAGDRAVALVLRRPVPGLRYGLSERALAQFLQIGIEDLPPHRGLALGAVAAAGRRSGRHAVGVGLRRLGAGGVDGAEAALRTVALLGETGLD